MNKHILFGAVALALSTSVHADTVPRWYVTPQVGALITDEDRNLRGDGDRLFGVAIGRHMNDSWSVELNANGAKVDTLAPYAATLDALRVFARDHALSPFLSVGAGAQRNDVTVGRDSTEKLVQVGAGLLWTLGENRRGTGSFSVRPEFKLRWNDTDREDFIDAVAMLGFQFSFGGRPRSNDAAQELAPAPLESLPSVAASAERDDDGDGVLNDRDRCPNTSSGVAVDEQGCTQQGSITLSGVQFDNDSAKLTPHSLIVLDRLAAELKRYPRLEIELQGHTDSVGSDRYNLALSQRRADAVRAYVLGQGVSMRQVVARGYGEAQPIASNDSAPGRAQNRRVVMVVLQNPGDVAIKSE